MVRGLDAGAAAAWAIGRAIHAIATPRRPPLPPPVDPMRRIVTIEGDDRRYRAALLALQRLEQAEIERLANRMIRTGLRPRR